MNVLRSSGTLSLPSWQSNPVEPRARRARRASDLAVHTVRTREAMLRLVPEWQVLHESRHDACPFQRPEWALAWLDSFVTPASVRPSTGAVDAGAVTRDLGLRVVTVRLDGRLVGLMPLLAYDEKPADGRGEANLVTARRRLVFVGDGLSDYIDAEVHPDLRDEVAYSLISELVGLEGWQDCRLSQLPFHSALIPVLRDFFPFVTSARPLVTQVKSKIEPGEPCPRVDLSEGFEMAVPSEQLARLRKYRRRAERIGALSLSVVTDPSEVDAAWQTILALHLMRWHERAPEAPTTSLADASVQAFQQRAMSALARVGAVRLYVLRLDNRPIAGLYAIAERDTLCCYLQGFDPEQAALSPGTLIVGAVLEDAVRQGMQVVDFLRGRESYKYRWGASEQATICFEAAR